MTIAALIPVLLVVFAVGFLCGGYCAFCLAERHLRKRGKP